MKKLILMLSLATIFAPIVAFALGYWRGSLWANRYCYELGLETGFHAGVSTAATAYESGGMDAVIKLESEAAKAFE